MGREARVSREAPRGVVKGNELRVRYIDARKIDSGLRTVKFSDRAYRMLGDGQLRRLRPGKE